MDLLARSMQGFEKPESLNVIHMEMGEEDVDARHLRPYAGPQSSDPCAGIEHHQASIIATHLNT
jgi:hypothetical protein